MTDLELLVPLDTGGAGTPLYCVHSSAGSAYSYFGLAQLLDRPVYGIEAPGFDGAREPVRSLPALAAEYADLLGAVRPAGPYLLLGWSSGGLLALEAARVLSAAGASAPLVVLVDVSVPVVTPLPPERDIVRRFLHEILATAGGSVPISALAELPADAPAADLLAVSSGMLPPELELDLLTDRYAVFRALVEASYGFEVAEAYEGKVAHVRASETPVAWTDWSPVLPRLSEHVVPGDHHSIWSAAALPQLAKVVDALCWENG